MPRTVDLSQILHQLQSNDPSLKSLILHNESLSINEVKELATSLSGNTFLTLLDLGRDFIGDQGATALARALEENTSLTSLDLAGNSIGFEGAWAIAKALKRNIRLKEKTNEKTLVFEAIAFAKKALNQNLPLDVVKLIFKQRAKDLEIKRTPQEIACMLSLVMTNVRSISQRSNKEEPVNIRWKNVCDGRSIFLFPPKSSFFPLPPSRRPPPIPDVDKPEERKEEDATHCVLQ